MVLLSRHGPRLLRQVAGKKHAGEADHERVARKEEEDVGREPESSGDEAPVEKVEVEVGRREEKVEVQKKVGVKGKRGGKMRTPGRGVFERGRVLKGGDGEVEVEEEGINWGMGMGSTPKKKGGRTFGKAVGYGTKSAGSQGTKRKGEDEGIYWGMGSTPPKKVRTRTVNVHAGGGRTFGKKVNSTAQAALPKEADLSHLDALDSAMSKDNALSSIIDAHDPYCDVSSDEFPSPSSNLKQSSFPPTTLDIPPTSPLTSLPDLPSPISPISPILSPPSTSPPPTCPLCLDPIEEDDYTSFYESHPGPRTVRLQMLFCRSHKKAAAEREYVAKGYPSIDWAALPGRIRGFRQDMIRILKNEGEESPFRTRYKERLASGKAAWLPRRRATKNRDARSEVVPPSTPSPTAEIPEEADDHNDEDEDLSLSTARLTGYYGPRGKRLIMEVLTLDLASEIRDAAVRDPVVGRSGFALFLQAVVVPEVVLRLVEGDFGVGRGEAVRLVGASWGVGGWVNGEVEEGVGEGGEGEEGEEDDGGDGEEEEMEEEE